MNHGIGGEGIQGELRQEEIFSVVGCAVVCQFDALHQIEAETVSYEGEENGEKPALIPGFGQS